MKTAFSYWGNRIAPMFDTASQVRVVVSEAGRIVSDQRLALPQVIPVQKVVQLTTLEIEILVCGAVSRSLHNMIEAYGIQVIPFVAGDLDEVVTASINGRLEPEHYAMPGCRRRGKYGAGAAGIGPPKRCGCPTCGYMEGHKIGVPCSQKICPQCGGAMIRG